MYVLDLLFWKLSRPFIIPKCACVFAPVRAYTLASHSQYRWSIHHEARLHSTECIRRASETSPSGQHVTSPHMTGGPDAQISMCCH